MRLNVPADVASVSILKGPGTTYLFQATVEKIAKPDFNPGLIFTIEDPLLMEPMTIRVEMIGYWRPVDFHYELEGLLEGNRVKIKYWLKKDETGYQGSISDL
jgi:hypothetical protein